MTEIPVTLDSGLGGEAKPFGPRPAAPVDIASLLPPGAVALADELDNTKVAARAEPDDGEAVTLEFVGDELPFTVIPLRYPFRWDGVRHDEIRVEQLTTAELGRIEDEWARTGNAPKLVDLYAVMAGLPAKVLRALPAVDGDRVFRAGYDFLPPSYRGEAG